jgi:hypothetical protein
MVQFCFIEAGAKYRKHELAFCKREYTKNRLGQKWIVGTAELLDG